ncbi:MAG: MoaD/ThiS family protein [Luteolibacter sp.]
MSQTYHIQWFGLLSERRGIPEETIQHAAITPAELYRQLAETHPLGLAMSDLRAAVNDEFIPWDHLLKDGDHIAFLPPMSGG